MSQPHAPIPALNRFSVPPLRQVADALAAVAAARLAPELVLTNARILSTLSQRLLPDRELWVHRGRIAGCRPAGSARQAGLDARLIVDLENGILAPGLVDAGANIETSTMTACAYAEMALLAGTTAIICDGDGLVGVAGEGGRRWLEADCDAAPLLIHLAGADTDDRDAAAVIAEALRREPHPPLADYPDIFSAGFLDAHCFAEGATIFDADAECDIAEALLEAGSWVFLRGRPGLFGAPRLAAAARTLVRRGCDTKRVCLCTEERDAAELLSHGLDRVVRQAVEAGLGRERAWSMASLHPASRHGLETEIGSLGGGTRADLVLLNDALEVRHTWFGGTLMVENGRPSAVLEAQAASGRHVYPDAAFRTVRLPEPLPRLTPPLPLTACRVNVLAVEARPELVLRHAVLRLEPEDGASRQGWPMHLREHDLCLVTVIERHGGASAVSHGLIRGFGLADGAVASSVGHGRHDILVAGTGEAAMRTAVAAIEAAGGGVVVVRGNTVQAMLKLPIAGLLSDLRAAEVAQQTLDLAAAWEQAGCRVPVDAFPLIMLPAIPEVRLTAGGLVTVPGMERLDLVAA